MCWGNRVERFKVMERRTRGSVSVLFVMLSQHPGGVWGVGAWRQLGVEALSSEVRAGSRDLRASSLEMLLKPSSMDALIKGRSINSNEKRTKH